MARRNYTDEQKASVRVMLESNDGNLKRTAREAGLPVSTIRRWRDDWKRMGVPPEIEKHVAVKATEFVEAAKETRGEALGYLKQRLPNAKPSELITIVGVLDDKVTRAEGLIREPDAGEKKPALSPTQLEAMFAGAVRGAVEAAKAREVDIIDVEPVEEPAQVALPPAETEEDSP